jgi:hypothetical protein
MVMWPLERILSVRQSDEAAPAAARRDRLAVLLALVAVVWAGAALFVTKGATFLMPGPMTSAHGGVSKCGDCHTKSGDGKLSWLHGLVAGDPRADSDACLTCHKMPDTAFNPHGASAAVLEASTDRLLKVAAASPAPAAARAQSAAFPTDGIVARGLFCATCHQEHQGVGFDLNKISNEQCRSCHVAKFDSFDGDHPKFDAYPFKTRTQIIYDHAGHFGKHYPELIKKDPAKRIPETCSTCHDSRDDKRLMATAPFDKTCAGCHLDQITGKERVSGPKGVAFLALPGLDLQTMKTKNAAIGEWPDASDAALTPFMKVMISRTEQGRALLKDVGGLNLQDLSGASDEQIKSVTGLAWEIKRLFFALIKGKASDVLGDLNIGGGAKLSASLVADLTAGIPRDVVIGAQQQWLPNLAAEIANGPGAVTQQPSSPSAAATEPAAESPPSSDEPSGADASDAAPNGDDAEKESADARAKRDPPACVVRVLGQCLVEKEPGPNTNGSPAAPAINALPGKMNVGAEVAGDAAPAPAASPKPETAGQTQKNASDDELLFPTEEEQRAIKAAQPESAPGKANAASPNAAAPPSQSRAAPVISIESDVDPESWAEYGGWYQQDHTIFYRPSGHKDKFIYTWLFLTGPQAPKGATGPAAAVFEFLTSKDVQGSCTKCHSVDDLQGRGRVVNFSPLTVAKKNGSFTKFIHEPHFSVRDDRGCLACHSLEEGRPYLKSYEQGDPKKFASNFGVVKKDLCQTCHATGAARQDCVLCHAYHVNEVVTPIMSTKLPVR